MKPFLQISCRLFPSYGVFCALGILAAFAVCLVRAYKGGLSLARMIVLFASALAFGFAGSVLTHLLVTYPPADIAKMFRAGAFFKAYTPGYVFYGGLAGGLLGGFLFSKIFSIRLCGYVPALLPALPLGHAFGRVGCFLAGCCYGVPCAFGFLYPEGSIAPSDVARFPVQLLEALLLVIISAALALRIKRGLTNPLRLYIRLYAPARFFLEFLRADEIRGSFLFFSTSQWISLLLLALTLLPVKSARKG